MLQDTSQADTISDETVPSSDNLTVQERQLWLNNASSKYLEGKISEETLRRTEEALEVDYAKAALDQTSVKTEVLSVLKRWLKSLSHEEKGKREAHFANDISTNEKR